MNIFAEPADGDFSKGGFAFTDGDGKYSLIVKPGTYHLRSFHPEYGEIGSITGVIVSTSDVSRSFVIPTPKQLIVAFTGAGLPTDLSNFEWSMNVSDRSNGRGFNQTFRSQSGYTFDKVPAGSYSVSIRLMGLGEVFSSRALDMTSDRTISVPLQGSQKSTPVTGAVTASGSGMPVSEAFVEIRDTNKKQVF